MADAAEMDATGLSHLKFNTAQRTPLRHNAASMAGALTSMLLLQTGIALSLGLMNDIGVAPATTVRLAFAALILSLCSGRKVLQGFRQLTGSVCALAASMAGMGMFFAAATHRLPLGLASALEFLGPFALAIWGTRRWQDRLWVVLAAIGVLLLLDVPVGQTIDVWGVLFALCAAFFWAMYIICTRRVGSVSSGFSGLAVSFTLAMLLTLPVAVSSWQGITTHQLLYAALCAVFLPLLPYVVEMATLRITEPRVFGLLMSLEPCVVAALIGFIFFRQTLSAGQILGVACVCAACFAVIFFSTRGSICPEPTST